MIPEFTINAAPAPITLQFLPLDGHIEAGLAQSAANAEGRALWLSGRIIGVLRRGEAEISLMDLSLPEFDALLAHLQTALFGPELRCEARCTSCQTSFEFALELASLQAAVQAEAGTADGEAVTDSETGIRFRMPRLSDLETLRLSGATVWMERLLLEGSPSLGEFEAAMSRAVPILSQDVVARCPDCETSNRIRFDIASHLTSQLVAEASFLWREVHLLARNYGWQLSDILSLTREDRRRLASFVIADAGLRRQAS